MADSIIATLKNIEKVLKTISGLTVSDGVPNSISTTPFAFIMPEEGTFDNDFGGDDTYTVVVTLLVARADVPSASNKVLPFFESMKARFNANQTLVGSVDWATLTGFRDYGRHDFAGQEFWGIEFLLTVQE